MADKNTQSPITEKIHLKRRRRFRQLLGAFVCFFVIIGAATTITSGFALINNAFDISDEIPQYQERVKYLVALDTLPFDDLSNAPTETLLYAAMYQAIDTNESNEYEFDENGQMYLPVDVISKAVEELYGPDEKFNYITFISGQFLFTFVPEKQAYLMPLTSPPTDYSPIAESLTRDGNIRRLTVGYDEPYDTLIEPVKYLDYIFERHDNGEYYLTAVVASDKKVENPVTEESTSTAPLPTDNEDLLDNAGDGILTEAENTQQQASSAAAETVEQAPEQQEEPVVEEGSTEETQSTEQTDDSSQTEQDAS